MREPPRGSPWDEPLDRAPLAFVDLEMTGLDPKADRVLEVCVERVRGERCEGRLETLVRPEGGAFGSGHVHNIDPAALAAAPSFASVAAEVLGLLDGAILVAHGAWWDVAFLDAELERAGRPERVAPYLDTLALSRRAFALPSHSLSSLVAHLGLARARAHRAGDDVRALRAVFRSILVALSPATPRDLWHVRAGERHARPGIVAKAVEAADQALSVRIRYRPSGRAPEELRMRLTGVRTDLDPPRVLGYLLATRSRRELRADRILAIESVPERGDVGHDLP